MINLIAQAAQSDDIKDIIILAPQASGWPVLIWVLIILLSIGLLIGLLVFVIKRSKKRIHQADPKVIAQKSLQQLQNDLPNREPNAFGMAVSETLKDYLSAKFNDPIRYETAEEFLSRFANSSIPVTHLPTSVHQNLRSFVSTSEEIKFGRAPDAKEKMEPLLALASTIIELIETVNHTSKGKDKNSII